MHNQSVNFLACILAIIGFMVIVIAPFTASAGTFSVTPLRVTIKSNEASTSFVLSNQGNESTLVQTELLAWSQLEGDDVLVPTNDLVVSPPIFQLAPGAAHTIRVGLLNGADRSSELSYRLFLQEVPTQKKNNEQGISTVLRLGLPVFIMPTTHLKTMLKWHAIRAPSGGMTLVLKNLSNTHIQAINCKIHDENGILISEQKLATYILSGQSHSWQIKSSSILHGDYITLNMHTDNEDIETLVTLE